MSRVAVTAALAGLAVGGCTIPLQAPQETGPTNTCNATRPCAEGASCVQGQCVATTFDLTGLLLEVVPHANATFGANTSFVTPVTLPLKGSAAGAFVKTYDVALPQLVSIHDGVVQVNSETPLDSGCELDALRTVPARVTFFPNALFAGLPSEPLTTSTVVGPTSSGHLANVLHIALVPGSYDIYVEPQPVKGCNGDGAYPPVLLSTRVITAGSVFSWEMPPLSPAPPNLGSISGSITEFGAYGTGLFKVDILEPTRGLVISPSVPLITEAGGYGFVAPNAWQGDTPILRLTPPEGATLPTGYWQMTSEPMISSSTAAPAAPARTRCFRHPPTSRGRLWAPMARPPAPRRCRRTAWR